MFEIESWIKYKKINLIASVSFENKLYTSLICQMQFIIVRRPSVYSSSLSDIYKITGTRKIIIGYYFVKFRARICRPDLYDLTIWNIHRVLILNMLHGKNKKINYLCNFIIKSYFEYRYSSFMLAHIIIVIIVLENNIILWLHNNIV